METHKQTITCDSRLVSPSDLFVVIPCARNLSNAQDAIKAGATTIVAVPSLCDSLAASNPTIRFIKTDNPRLALSLLAGAFYKKQPRILVAVTGTNGKSSVVNMLRQFWEGAGFSAASLGTLGLASKNLDISLPSLTTLDPLTLHKTLAELYTRDIQHLALEASSHGLDQYRLHGVTLSAAAFTNLSHDHLDYHGTLDAYFAAKAKLFTEILPDGSPVVLNQDSPFYEKLSTLCLGRNHRVISYSLTRSAFLQATNIATTEHSISFDLSIDGIFYPTQAIPLVGLFQLENVLCAMGLAIATGLPVSAILKTLSTLLTVPGRLEYVGSKNNAPVYVDYAHTPDALENVLKSLRRHTLGKLWVVFGCGGNRDASKRPKMGAIAAALADMVIVTNDNPRHENADDIRDQILKSCPLAKNIENRSDAIHYAITNLAIGDVLLIAGKGHEQGQIIGDIIHPFDDRVEALKYLCA
ncbi:MAG: UDP-N-acetylmuramoyl-L-alanyl-D-glutamate--2,6-diaminopimelate ligase [Alphaproteobacteria bacterium]|nr:UDP-N-acetylmuramoyl-L-alanyl-D-glutamate--2,6-diaminopimelate ligase [Alphaproteobacteria bacterium]